MQEIGEIKNAVNSFNNTTNRKALVSRWDTDFDLYRLKPYDAGKGYYSYTSNASRNLAHRIISMLRQAKLLIRIPPEEMDEKERRAASTFERFLYGALNLNDERLLRMGEPPLRDSLAWLLSVRGRVVVKILVNKDDDGKTTVEVSPWDAYSVAYGMGAKGLTWAAHTTRVTKEAVEDQYPNVPLAKNKREFTIIDFWDKTNNGVIVENSWGKTLEPHGLDYCPVYPIMSGAMPSVMSNDIEEMESERGDSVYYSNRGLYPLLNKTMSDLLTIVRRGVKTPLVVKSRDGKVTLDQDVYQVEKAAAIPISEDVEITELIKQTMPADASPLVATLMGEEQRGGLSHVNYGELGFRLSGYALNQLQAAITAVVSPFVQAMEQAYLLTCLEIRDQFTAGGYKPIEVMGRTSRNEAFGYPKRLKIRSTEVKKDWQPEVRLEPIYPKDDAQRYLLANQARQGELPLLSDQTIRDEILRVEDPDLEREKIFSEWAANLPLVRLAEALKACLARGDVEGAMFVAAEMERMGQTAPRQRQAGQQLPLMSPAETGAVETPGAGFPPQRTGMRPEIMPSEALGGFPAGAAPEAAVGGF